MKSFLLRLTPHWLLGIYHFKLAFGGALVFGFPSRKLRVIGVTGTKGKTTVVHLLHRLLEENGKTVASLSSLRFKIKDKEERNELKMTMPGRLKLQRFLHKALNAGCEYVVLEVTSQGITQHRHRFIRFAGAVMTNVAPEHLEAHGGFEQYLKAKCRLFQAVGPEGSAVINRDDPNAESFAEATKAQKIWYGKAGITLEEKTLPLTDVELRDDGLSFVLGETHFSSQLIGEFNLYNILAAVSAALHKGLPLEGIAAAIAHAPGIPGRMEYVQREPFAVVVDYAHTPDSLRAVYETLKPQSLQRHSERSEESLSAASSRSFGLRPQDDRGRLICVLGSTGGGRDRWKRPEMGKIAAEYCDRIILTNEDPYDENPEAILDDIEVGVLGAAGHPERSEGSPGTAGDSSVASPPQNDRGKGCQKILDRREAVKTAVAMAQPGDTVVITGKGAEPWLMGPKGTKIPWDDRAVAREALRSKLHLPEKTDIVSTI